MEIKNHNKDRKRTGMRKRFSIAAYLAVFACVVLLVFQYFGFISKTVLWGKGQVAEVTGSGKHMMLKLIFPNDQIRQVMVAFAPIEKEE